MSRHYTIAPDQIRTQGFGRKVRGYDPRQVRSFLFEVAEQIDQLSRELNNAKQRLAAAEDSSISADTSGRQAVADQADRTDPGVAVRSAATAEAEANDKIKIYTGTTIDNTDGQPGLFDVTLSNGQTEKVGAFVMSSGWKPYDKSKLTHLGAGLKGVVTSVEKTSVFRSSLHANATSEPYG